jgi:hypothetical protein
MRFSRFVIAEKVAVDVLTTNLDGKYKMVILIVEFNI